MQTPACTITRPKHAITQRYHCRFTNRYAYPTLQSCELPTHDNGSTEWQNDRLGTTGMHGDRMDLRKLAISMILWANGDMA